MCHFRVPSSQRKPLYKKLFHHRKKISFDIRSLFEKKLMENTIQIQLIILTIIFLIFSFHLHLPRLPRSTVYREEDVVKRTRGEEERFKDSRGSNGGTISLEELASIRIVKVSRARLYRALDQHCKDLQFQLHP